MKNYNLSNLITGWAVFFIAAAVYLLTIEPTTSFWDCGEFITTAYKMEVGHPPGAPFFMLIGRFFTLFANPHTAALSMNIMSALASAFTILFLFWSITHLAKKVIISGEEYTTAKIVSIIGAGFVGALAYTFSDTFWFSAVEAEVYASSSLFTAVVFWAILKWENMADEPHSNRWLVLIAFLMGISIGVHLLNLLAIPAIAFVYYFRKYEVNTRGIIAVFLVSVAILGAMVYLIIPGIVSVGSVFELVFVNSFGFPYHVGLVIYTLVLMFALGYFVYYTHKRGKVWLNTIAISLVMISIGYSTYAIIIIRSDADTPLDQSNPETAFSLLRYLNREQYGQSPLVYGNYFNAPAVRVVDAKPVYYKKDGKYLKVPGKKYEYDDNFKGFFPRMHSDGEDHINHYIFWAGMNEADLYEVVRNESGQPVTSQSGAVQFDRNRPTNTPTFGQNMRFFFRYQIGYMYLRYFMWNFAGRQNDLQGHGELNKGNWISGIKFIDEARLGPQDNLPDYLKNNKARNKYYMLPFLLGIIGMIFHYKKDNKDFWIVTMLFVLTGLAILVYLNQNPLQPRERDYAYAGSFYAFAIWIGLGVAGLIHWINKNYNSVLKAAAVILITTLLVPGIMARENWDDHDRSGRYFARDFAWNYLQSVEENAVLFTNGDNDTFPLWYLQEVEGVRTDVRVSNLSYLTADWYIEQMQNRFYESAPLPIVMNEDQYRQGTRDFVFLVDNAKTLIDEKYNANKQLFEREYADIYQRFLEITRKSKVPELAATDYAELQKGYDKFSIDKFSRAVNTIDRNKSFGVNENEMAALKTQIESFISRLDGAHVPLSAAMRFLRSDDPRFQRGSFFIPATKFSMNIDKERIKAEGIFKGQPAENLVSEMRWEVDGRRGVSKNLMIILDMIEGNSNWERPIYFAITASRDNYLGLEKYLHREGLAYRLIPSEGNDNDLFSGSVNTDVMYDNVMNKFRWGGIEQEGLFLDENVQRMLSNFRYTFATLANALYEEGRNDSARYVLDTCQRLFPNHKLPFNAAVLPIIQIYYELGDTVKANEIVDEFATILDQELAYYSDLQNFNPARFSLLASEQNFAMRSLYNLFSLTSSNKQDALANEMMMMIQKHDASTRNMFQFQ
jgi:hypothetical protein